MNILLYYLIHFKFHSLTVNSLPYTYLVNVGHYAVLPLILYNCLMVVVQKLSVMPPNLLKSGLIQTF